MDILEQFKNVKMFVFDIDGVLTDGTVLVLDGMQARRMSIKDGFALQMALKKGYKLVIISGGYSDAVKDRLEKLGVRHIHMSIEDKKGFLSDYIKRSKIDWEDVLYMGDDIPDYSLMKLVGLSCCPADAVAEIRDIVKYISPFNGGLGCVRDVIEKVLKLNEHWDYDTDIASR